MTVRRSLVLPPALDARIEQYARLHNMAVCDVLIDAAAAHVGYKLTKLDTHTRKPHFHNKPDAAANAKARTAKAASTLDAVRRALADPERERILNQIMGVR